MRFYQSKLCQAELDIVVNVKYNLQYSFSMLDGKVKCLQKRAVMRPYSDLAINAYIADANFHYTECDTAKLLKESCK